MALHKCNINLDPDFHWTDSPDSYNRREPYSPASYSVARPPSFEESVRHDLLGPCADYPFSDTWNRAFSALRHELASSRISTFDEVASLVNTQISKSEPELALNGPIFSARCRVEQAMYNSRKVCWLRDRLQRAANGIVSPGGEQDVEASHPPLANAVTDRLHEMNNGVSYASSPSIGTSNASTTPSITLPTKRKKCGFPCKEPRRKASDGEASQITKCPQCKQTFSGSASDQKTNLSRHVEHKHPRLGQAFKHVCPECGDGFPRSDYLLNHRRRGVHNLPKSVDRMVGTNMLYHS